MNWSELVWTQRLEEKSFASLLGISVSIAASIIS
jgi:hypothetical protein